MVPNVLSGFTIDRAAADGFALVPDGLALGQSEFTLDEVLLQVEPGGNQRQAALLGPASKLVDLRPVQQQSPFPHGRMIEVAARQVATDVAVDQPYFVVANQAVAVFQV